tara:strand:- start:1334 stop:1999 length:666 start_codon:yes stop_codon:yes gene_type:complete
MVKKSNMKLYTDDRPKTTIKGTGFKDKKTAKKTIKLIKNRSIMYKKALVITMLNRAKYHPHKNENMEEAIEVFEDWMEENKDKKIKYEYLDLDLVKKYEKLAKEYDISKKARGLEKPTKSDKGFLVIYKKFKGNKKKLSFTPIKKENPEGQDYDSHRESFINQRLGQIKAKNGDLYYKDGKYKGLPTKQHLVMIMHAYSPDKKKIEKKLDLLEKKLKNNFK